MNEYETLGAFTAFISVAFSIKKHYLAWVFSIVSSLLYAKLFFDSGLKANFVLQFFFVLMSFWGIYQWLKGKNYENTQQKSKLEVRFLKGLKIYLFYFFVFVLSFLGLIYWLKIDISKGFMPFLDVFTTNLSIFGQYLLANRYIENWYFWLLANVLYVFLYISTGFYLTAFLYFVFFLMSYQGLKNWLKN